MLLRSVCFSPAVCDMLILQSPWIPVLQEYGHDLVQTLREKNIKIRIFCGSDDEDCMPMAKRLYTVTKQAGIDVEFSVIAVDFLLVTIFYRGGSLLSCIFDHAAINMLGFMLLSGWRLGFCRYMICFVAVNLFILLMMSWNWIR